MDPRNRNQAARDWSQKAKIEKERRRQEARATAPMMLGDPQSITGRLAMPGELPGVAAIGSQENIFGVEESTVLTTKTSE
jgi:hypothetical protein